jgi:GT2 family glycosyltransferase
MDELMTGVSRIGVVVIGRNEGERLKRCLRSLPEGLPVVYVDSGSTDGSIDFAGSIGVTVVALDMSVPFTAARARNAGWKALMEGDHDLEFIQFVDGDCEIDQGWFASAEAALQLEPGVAAVFGRLRERFPESSLFNQMCDDEWNVPLGIVDHCGGNAMIRLSAITAVGGFNDQLIAGEEPDLCLRMREIGFRIRRIDAEMGLHDAAMFTFDSWWKRTKRSGYAYTEHVWRHGKRAFPTWRRQLNSIGFWALGMPFIVLLASLALVRPSHYGLAIAFAFVAAAYSFQILRMTWRKTKFGESWDHSIRTAALMMLGKIPQALGALDYLFDRALKRKRSLIEHRANA